MGTQFPAGFGDNVPTSLFDEAHFSYQIGEQNWKRYEGKVDYLKLTAGEEVNKFLKELEESND